MRRSRICPFAMVTTSLLVMACAAYEPFYLLTGRIFPLSIVERLDSPVKVCGWTQDELLLADGRMVKLPGLTRLPAESDALKHATAGGVEVADNGRVYGLLKIHHWCGNDPIRNHVVRVDLSHLLVFLGEGKPKSCLRDDLPNAGDVFAYSEYGWEMTHFALFQHFDDTLKKEATAFGLKG